MSNSSEDELSHFKPSGNLYLKVSASTADSVESKSTAAASTTTSSTGHYKYFECEDSCRPSESTSFRVFVFKGKETADKFSLDRRSFYRLGRDQHINHIHLQHESISSQHAILQYRQRQERGQPRLYLMDLDSRNGTRLNGSAVEGRRFYEILDGDVVNFADSTRDYVFIKNK